MRMLRTRANTNRKAVLLTQPKHSINGMITDTANAPMSSYLNLLTSDVLRNVKPSSDGQSQLTHGGAVVTRYSPVGGGAVNEVMLDAILSRLSELSIAFVYGIVKSLVKCDFNVRPCFHVRTVFTIANSEMIRGITKLFARVSYFRVFFFHDNFFKQVEGWLRR